MAFDNFSFSLGSISSALGSISSPLVLPVSRGRHGKLVDNFIHESDVTKLQDPFTSRPYTTPFYLYYCVPRKIRRGILLKTMNALRLPFPTFNRPAVQFSSCVSSRSGFPSNTTLRCSMKAGDGRLFVKTSPTILCDSVRSGISHGLTIISSTRTNSESRTKYRRISMCRQKFLRSSNSLAREPLKKQLERKIPRFPVAVLLTFLFRKGAALLMVHFMLLFRKEQCKLECLRQTFVK